MALVKRSDVLVIGTGHGGCQIVDSIVDQNICKCILANSAIGDLNGLFHAKPEDKLHFEGGTGSGSDRAKGKKFAKENMLEIFRRIDTTNAHHIYIVAAAAGGTGSGSAIEMAKAIGHRYHPDRTPAFRLEQGSELPDRLVHVIGITPSESDDVGIKGFENNIEFQSELKELVDLGYVRSYTFLDNTTVENKLDINLSFAEHFAEFLAVPENTDGLGSAIDLTDMSTVMSSQGMFQFTEFTLTPENPEVVNIHKDTYFPVFEKGCENLIITTPVDNPGFTKHIRAFFGEPKVQTKTGLTKSDKSMAFAFGMDFPASLLEKSKQMHARRKELIAKGLEGPKKELDFSIEAIASPKEINRLDFSIPVFAPTNTAPVKRKSPADLRAEKIAKARGLI